MADDITVLETLRDELTLRGISLLGKFKSGPRNIQFKCPVHNDGQESKPSCGISTADKVRGKSIVEAGTVNCFTCGYKASLSEMVSYCFGREDGGRYGRAWLFDHFISFEVESRRPIVLNLDRRKKEVIEYVDEAELDTYRSTHSYLYSRKMTDDIIDKFDLGYDPKFMLNKKDSNCRPIETITFPVRDLTGGTLFVARRAIYSKLFHYPDEVNKPVYGIYELSKYWNDAKEIILCESIFNALTCWIYGRPAVAMLGLGTSYQYDVIRRLKPRKVVCGFDPDEAGSRATNNAYMNLKAHKLVSKLVIPSGYDINDLTYDQFLGLTEIF